LTTLRLGFVAVVRPAFKGDGASVAQRSGAYLAELASASGAELVDAGAAVRDAAEAVAAADRLAELRLDLLVIQHATFATGDLLAPLLAAAPRAVVWAVPESAGSRVGGPDGASGPLPLNSLCGLNMTLSFAEGPRGGARGPVGWCYGEPGDPALRSRLRSLLAAERGVVALAATRVLAIGGTAPGFYGLEQPPLPLGATVIARPLTDLFDRVAGVDARPRRRMPRPGAPRNRSRRPGRTWSRPPGSTSPSPPWPATPAPTRWPCAAGRSSPTRAARWPAPRWVAPPTAACPQPARATSGGPPRCACCRPWRTDPPRCSTSPTSTGGATPCCCGTAATPRERSPPPPVPV
jgi:hypothetical protein